tara:strand:+ start:122 stop:1252 length:1131 start_codon:yes stop_codon:yes gene_type:complete
MALNTVSSDRLSTNVKTSNLGTELKGKIGQDKNLITNGAMICSQRGSSFATVSNNETTIDQFALTHPYGSSTMSISQSTTSPNGFSNSYKLDVNSADTSIGAGQYVAIRHRIEAQNLQELAFGTSGAKSIALSFYVRSNVTGTYAVNIQQTDNSKKQVSATYTINSADTWERKTFTFAGDTSGVINNDTGDGFEILWYLAAGSNRNSGTARSTFTAHNLADEAAGHTANILSSTSNNFHLTGCQLEVGSVITDFQHLSFGENLKKCQRYYYQFVDGDTQFVGIGHSFSSSEIDVPITFQTAMRTAPTLNQTTGGNYFGVLGGGDSTAYVDGNWTIFAPTEYGCWIYATPDATITAGNTKLVRSTNASARLSFTAEL